MTLVASVMMIAGTPNSATPTPLTRPISAPAARISGPTHSNGRSWPPQKIAIRIAAQLSTQGTERSMPPPMMTKVWPSATMPMKAASTSEERRLDSDRKPGEKKVVTMSSTSMPT
jgi:hypothetical protein